MHCRTHLVDCCEAAGFTPTIRHTTDDYVVVQNLVARGLGVTVLPASALAAYRHPDVRVVPMAALGRRHVGLALRPGADLVPATAALVGEIVRSARRTVGSCRRGWVSAEAAPGTWKRLVVFDDGWVEISGFARGCPTRARRGGGPVVVGGPARYLAVAGSPRARDGAAGSSGAPPARRRGRRARVVLVLRGRTRRADQAQAQA